MGKLAVYGLGHAICDIIVRISENDFQSLSLTKGSMELVDPQVQQSLLKRFSSNDPRLVGGGSVGNSIVAVAQLGAPAGLACCLGDDKYGLHYKEEFDSLGIQTGNSISVGNTTGTCISLVTPDGERTMRTCLGIASSLSAEHLDESAIKNCSWVFLEGYLFTNGERGMQAMEKAIKLARKYGAKVALTFSDGFIVDLFKENLTKIVKQVDLVFANEREAAAFTGGKTPEESFRALTTIVPNVAMTAGPKGAFISFNRKVDHVEAYPCTPLDLTGAGDMFAGGFLYGVSQGLDSRKVARASCYLAMKVISQIGARLHVGTREGWDLSWSET